MLDEVVSFALEAPVKSTSEVLDECAVPSVLLREKKLNGKTTILCNNKNTNFTQKEIPRVGENTFYLPYRTR